VSTLIRKLKRAKRLVGDATEAYRKFTASANPSDIAEWTRDSAKAQNARQTDVQAMDYFALNINSGLCFVRITTVSTKSKPCHTAPGTAEMQLRLTEKELLLGHFGLAKFLADGIRIQESQ
jgi:hypothetical protein